MTNYLARLVLLGLLGVGPAVAGTFIAPRVSAVPGGVVTFRIPGPPDRAPTVVFNERQMLVVRQQDAWLAVVGIGLSIEPGEYHVDVQELGGGERKLPFTVKPKGQAKDKWDFLALGAAVPEPDESLEVLAPTREQNECVL